jgi:hypothetical protein
LYVSHDPAINTYFIYDGLLTTIVLNSVHQQIAQKKEVFYQRIDKRKELVLALMQ